MPIIYITSQQRVSVLVDYRTNPMPPAGALTLIANAGAPQIPQAFATSTYDGFDLSGTAAVAPGTFAQPGIQLNQQGAIVPHNIVNAGIAWGATYLVAGSGGKTLSVNGTDIIIGSSIGAPATDQVTPIKMGLADAFLAVRMVPPGTPDQIALPTQPVNNYIGATQYGTAGYSSVALGNILNLIPNLGLTNADLSVPAFLAAGYINENSLTDSMTASGYGTAASLVASITRYVAIDVQEAYFQDFGTNSSDVYLSIAPVAPVNNNMLAENAAFGTLPVLQPTIHSVTTSGTPPSTYAAGFVNLSALKAAGRANVGANQDQTRVYTTKGTKYYDGSYAWAAQVSLTQPAAALQLLPPVIGAGTAGPY